VEQVVCNTGTAPGVSLASIGLSVCLATPSPLFWFFSGKKEYLPNMSERISGVVKWFNSQKGYGFIEREGGPDVFVHYTAVVGEGWRNLEEGDHVEFSITQGPKGPQASEVVRQN
jgi:CspA family cold shock protein